MNDSDQPSGSRRRFLLFSSAAFGIGALGGVGGSLLWASNSSKFSSYVKRLQTAEIQQLSAEVLPPQGFELEVSLGDSIQRLVQAGVISPAKFQAVYAKRGGLPEWVGALFEQPSSEPITISMKTAPYLLNLLWPLGVATKVRFNEKSILNGPKGGNFASTGGWTLGEARNGGEYFNKISTLALSAEQEATVFEAAENSFRPCCNNSTFFQDCNHGSALLGLYELAAAQGAGVDGLYEIGRIANCYWYPPKYMEMAYYFHKVENKRWDQVATSTVLGKNYSSIAGWQKNVHQTLVKAGLLPHSQGGGGGSGCGV